MTYKNRRHGALNGIEKDSYTDVNETFSCQDKKSTPDLNMTVWSTHKGFCADITGFQFLENRKTFIRNKLKHYACALFLLSVLASALTIVDTQITVNRDEKTDFLSKAMKNFSVYNQTNDAFQEEQRVINLFTKVEIVLKSSISVLTVITLVALYLYYQHLYQLKVLKNHYPRSMSFIRATPLLTKFVFECSICAVHLPPFVTHMGVSPKLQLTVMLRLYLLARYLKEKHDLMNNPSTRFLASVTKTDLSSMFLFKTFFMQYPFQLILLAYTVLLFVGGYCVWLLEDNYTYLDTVWMLIITMTTVGFGDLTPKTMLGRVTVGLAAVIGIFLMALLISLVNDALMLQRREKRILSYIENTDHLRHNKTTALNAIGAWYKYYSFKNQHLKSRDGTKQTLLAKTDERRKVDIVKIAKGKVLESRMYFAINQWRRVKGSQVSGYFAQEFMVEDIKNMMGHFDTKVKEIEIKLDQVLESSTKTNNVQRLKMEPKQMQLQSCKMESAKENDSNNEYSSLDYAVKSSNNYKEYEITGNPLENKPEESITSSHQNAQRFFFQQPLQKHDKQKNSFTGDYKTSLGNEGLQTAFKILHNQAQLMNTALDDVYHKTKQDIEDLENIISSLLVCSENENSLPLKV